MSEWKYSAEAASEVMKNAPFITELCDCAENMYRLGWNERNGGNISVLLQKDEVSKFLGEAKPKREILLSFDCSELAGSVFLVTGTGQYFKNIQKEPEKTLGIVRIAQDGRTLELLWGFSEGGMPTSEFPTHLMNHIVRLKEDSNHRVVMHCHPTNLVAMTCVHELSDRSFTEALWKMCSECVVVFPEGISVLPWMVCGTEEIGRATAEHMRRHRAVIWAHHGIVAAGTSIDEVFGLVETIEKAAELYFKVSALPIRQMMTIEQVMELAEAFEIRDKMPLYYQKGGKPYDKAVEQSMLDL